MGQQRMSGTVTQLDKTIEAVAENQETWSKAAETAEANAKTLDKHTKDTDIHITTEEREKWDGASELAETNKTDIASVTEQAVVNQQTLGYQRKNLLKNTATTQTINGVTFTVGEDGSVTASGTATDNALLYIYGTANTTSGQKPIDKGNYVLSGCPSGGSDSTYRMRLGYRSEDITTNLFIVDYGEGANLDLSYDTIGSAVIQIMSGVTVDNLVFKPMLRDARITDSTYEAYKPSVADYISDLESRLAALESAAATTTEEV